MCIIHIQKMLTALLKERKYDEIKEFLVKNGTDEINKVDEHGIHPIWYVVSSRGKFNQDLLECLIICGMEINHPNRYGQTMLSWATESGFEELFIILMNFEPNLDKQDFTGNTALHEAVHFLRTEFVKVLLDAGADPNIKDKDGWTPLMLLAFGYRNQFILGQTEQRERYVLKLLLRNDADYLLKNNEGKTAIDIALQMNKKWFLEEIMNYEKQKNKVTIDMSSFSSLSL